MSDLVKECLLVGVGPMGVEYAKVLKFFSVAAQPIGRGAASAENFKTQTGLSVQMGGVASLSGKIPEHAIVSTSVESLAATTIDLIKKGVRKILVEKPAGLSRSEIREVADVARNAGVKVFVAYNRRFFASVLELKKRVEAEGGPTSGHFEFTEWSHVLDTLPDSPAKRTTFLSNSTHVIDLAFHLLGTPKELTAYTNGLKAFPWNEGPSRFAGAGVTDRAALFTYCANWTAPGRWGVEVLTKESRYILRPMEKLQRQPLGSVRVDEVEIDLTLETALKPGLAAQVKEFLSAEPSGSLLKISDHVENFEIYQRIASL